jgi:hypothetical protein
MILICIRTMHYRHSFPKKSFKIYSVSVKLMFMTVIFHFYLVCYIKIGSRCIADSMDWNN